MNTFTFENAKLSLIELKGTEKKLISARVEDRHTVTDPDGTVRSLFTCSRFISIFNEDLVQYVIDNMINTNQQEFQVNLSGYLSTTKSKTNNKFYDNQVVTELELID